MLPCVIVWSWLVTSERRRRFVVKARELQVWEFSVVLEASWPYEGIFLPITHGCGYPFCLFCVDGNGRLLHWHTLPKLELITTGGVSALPDLLGLFSWLTSSSVCSLLLLPWCQDWNCKSSLPWGKAVSVLFLLTIPPLNQQDGSHQIWQSECVCSVWPQVYLPICT